MLLETHDKHLHHHFHVVFVIWYWRDKLTLIKQRVWVPQMN